MLPSHAASIYGDWIEEFDMATWVSIISKKTLDMEHGAMIMNET